MGSILSALRFKFPRNTWKSTTASASPNPGSRESPPSSASAEAANVSSTSQKSSPADSPNGAPVKARNIPSVSFSPASHKAEPFPSVREITSLLFLGRTCPEAFEHTKDIIHCSIGSTPDVKPQKNGFVHTVLECYNEHHALTIRPDDVWIAILTQFSFFVGGNAEALRSLFVLHEGKKELTMMVEQEEGKVDWDVVVQMVVETMNRKIQENVIDPELRQWIIPAFSTTTANDRLVAGIVMMATLKEFFLYKASSLCCGIPRVTLEGERDDWVYLLNRIDKLKEFGPQTTNWYHLLRPILSRFVKAFDKPDSRKNLEFWRKVAHFESDGSGPTWLSGWITAFMTFNAKGRWQGGNQHVSFPLFRDTQLKVIYLYTEQSWKCTGSGWCEIPSSG